MRASALEPALCAAIAATIGRERSAPVSISGATEIGGGSISRTLRLESGRERWFVKVHERRLAAMFAAEADGLAALAACPELRVPRVVGQGASGGHAYLVLEYLELQGLGESNGAAAGRALAALHRICGAQHGWHGDNFIGSTAQSNSPHADWPTFFARQRLLPQLELARRKARGGARLIADGERLAEQLPALFTAPYPLPSLVHGDLWSGNAASDGAGRLAVFDPAVYFGDRETDLAMTQLFGGFPASFHAAYREAWPLAAGYPQRRTLYQLYHVLNHLNLFGGAYLQQAERMISGLLAELGS